MVSRRQVLARGGTGIAALGLGLPSSQAFASQALGAPLSPAAADIGLFVIDSAISGATQTADAVQAANIRATVYSGDIGTPWLTQIEPMWRSNPRPIAGLTFGGAFFCLEHLAQTYGLACTLCLTPSKLGQVGPTGAPTSEDMAASVIRAMNAPANFAQAGLGTPRVEEGQPLIWRLQPKISRHSKPTDRG